MNVKNENIRRIKLPDLIFFIFILGLSILEILAYLFKGISSQMAVYVWLAMGLYYFLKTTHIVIATFVGDIKRKNILGILAIAFLTFILFYNSGFDFLINSESTQQSASALQNIRLPDYGYTQAAFLGYPSRQYLITTLPSFIFGKYPWTLNLGYIYPVLISINVFYVGIAKLFSSHPSKNIISSLAIFFVFLCNYTLPFSLHFEQSILPLAFTMQAAAWLIICIKDTSKQNLLALTWIGCLLSTTYTPGYASWSLLLAILIYLAIQSLRKHTFQVFLRWAAITLPIIIFGLLSLYSVTISANNKSLFLDTANLQIISQTLANGFFIFLSLDPKESFFHPIIFLPVWTYLISSIIGLNGPKNAFLTLWIFAVVSASVLMHGYANPPPDLSIHRSMIILPFLCIAILIWLEKMKLLQYKKSLILLYFSAMIYIPFAGKESLYHLKPEDSRISVMREVISSRDEMTDPTQPMRIYISSADGSIFSLNDMLSYFLEKDMYQLTFVDSKECFIPTDSNTKTIMITDSEHCAAAITNTNLTVDKKIEKSNFKVSSQGQSWHKIAIN